MRINSEEIKGLQYKIWKEKEGNIEICREWEHLKHYNPIIITN